jgi:hypothetical protein
VPNDGDDDDDGSIARILNVESNTSSGSISKLSIMRGPFLLVFDLLFVTYLKAERGTLLSQRGESRTVYIHKSPGSVECLHTFCNCFKHGMVIVYGLQNRGNMVRFRGKIIFSMPKCPDRYWGPPSLLPNRHRGSFRVLKRPKSEVYHSPPFSAEV